MITLKKHRPRRDVIGFRLPMQMHEEAELDICDITVVDPDNTFYFKMGSDAMASYHILKDHVLVIDRSLKPVTGSIVVFFHEDAFYTREYCPEAGRLLLKSDEAPIIIEDFVGWTCWGVVMVTLNPVLQPQHRMGRYTNVCAC